MFEYLSKKEKDKIRPVGKLFSQGVVAVPFTGGREEMEYPPTLLWREDGVYKTRYLNCVTGYEGGNCYCNSHPMFIECEVSRREALAILRESEALES